MSYNQFQAELSKISSSHLQLPRLAELLFIASFIVFSCFVIRKINVKRGFIKKEGIVFLEFLNKLSFIIGIILVITIITTFLINDSEKKQLITNFIEDSSNFNWKEIRSDPLVPFPVIEKENQPIYLKINNHSVFEYNIDMNGEIEYQKEENKIDFKYGIGRFEQKVYWSNDIKKVADIPSKVRYEYKLKDDTFYKNEDKLPRKFWSELNFYNSKEKVVFYIPEKMIIDKNE
ncbi:hypothetical protein CKN63_13255 [Carnobacterium divergens]|uniref:hypothetical protein n=1 Tax=Carnobacterium divergens TaxID=2748 RepID=UPI001071D8A5|nr:hypothetical protein [Carnobacterium divergens]TFI60528.1 hypothetical protein CKN59_13190 [Carnobacterium divergens]TFI61672.1 hypothetical protein CKN76_12795 [Carnobacterium divergens]TFJ01003.1 hypothetical protein CKN75_12780 [Carnobacterium divergens]TFJ08923.1 hypothetical protein CKN71_12795 [Carnobacterium divergens]TFJ15632.1 hypothetical protein CKN63_13255 [Carnobacterium divergens]